jgi:O-antigen/teichoic acid export membrane protein
LRKDLSDLKLKTARGSLWMTGIQLGMRPFATVVDIVLLRLLVPEDYGLVALAMILMTTANLFTDLGMRQVVIQTRQDINKVAYYAFIIVMFGSVVATALVFFLAEPFARILGGNENLVPVLQVMSIYITIDGLLLIPDSLLRRELKFKQVALAQIPGELGKSLLAVPLALMGFGVWSLVFGMLFSKVIQTVQYWIYQRPWIWLKPQPWDRQVISGMVRFGVPTTISGFMTFFQNSIDTWYVGRQLGQVAVGYYNRAFSLTTRINRMVTSSLFGQVLFSSYSAIQEERSRLARAYLKSTNMVYLMMTPVSLGMAVTAPLLVQVLIGEKWMPMVPVWQFFSLYGLTQPISANSSPVFLAVGKPKNNVIASFVLLSIMIPLLLILTPAYGIVGAAIAVSLAHLVAMFFNVWQVEQILEGTAKATLLQSLPFMVAGGLMVLGVLLLQDMIINLAGGENIISLILVVVLGALIYLGVVLLLRRDLLMEIYGLTIQSLGLGRRWPRLVPRSARVK